MTVNCNRHIEGDRETPGRELPADWPWRRASLFVRSGQLRWHLQYHPSERETGNILLLLHGTGASAHSWADLIPLLTPHSCVLTLDLPGHGYTLGATSRDLTLPGMATALAQLLQGLALKGRLVVAGHSAGAPLAIQWALDHGAGKQEGLQLAGIIGLNPSLVPPPSLYTLMLGPVIAPLATSGPVTQLLAYIAGNTGMVDQLLDSTGSHIPQAQRTHYRALFRRPEHVQGAMGFMAAADLPALLEKGRRTVTPIHFLLGEQDPWVRAAPLRDVIRKYFPAATTLMWPGGHLIHEERPGDVARMILDVLKAG
jgi:magnesium chelatase accessory protein